MLQQRFTNLSVTNIKSDNKPTKLTKDILNTFAKLDRKLCLKM